MALAPFQYLFVKIIFLCYYIITAYFSSYHSFLFHRLPAFSGRLFRTRQKKIPHLYTKKSTTIAMLTHGTAPDNTYRNAAQPAYIIVPAPGSLPFFALLDVGAFRRTHLS